jgi:hypothetical protein
MTPLLGLSGFDVGFWVLNPDHPTRLSSPNKRFSPQLSGMSGFYAEEHVPDKPKAAYSATRAQGNSGGRTPAIVSPFPSRTTGLE